jgi:hypothetical protein
MGDLYIDGSWFCRTLEDFDRNLFYKDALADLQFKKVADQTCIPRGIYDVQITPSHRFKRLMPQIMSVPAFEGIRIHAGNTDNDTEGCILLGRTSGYNFVGESQKAFNEFFPLLKTSLEHSLCNLEILNLNVSKKTLL